MTAPSTSGDPAGASARVAVLEAQNRELRAQVEQMREEMARLRAGAAPNPRAVGTTRGRAVVAGIALIVVATLGAAAVMQWEIARQAHNGGYPEGVAPAPTRAPR
jgi:hypothetical protein